MAIEQKRIEDAANHLREIVPIGYEMTDREARFYVRKVLNAAFPELASDPPTGWVAPWEATPTMVAAFVDAGMPREASYGSIGAWPAMRDAHRKEQGHE